MPSFDITSKPDLQLLDNAVNISRKELLNRFDFKGSKTEIDLDKKTNALKITTEDEMRLNSVLDILKLRMIRQKLDPRCLDETKVHYNSGLFVKKEVLLKTGIGKDVSKKIIADIKTSSLKVSSQIMDDFIRVSSKKIDDLQKIIALMRTKDYEQPLQFINMKS